MVAVCYQGDIVELVIYRRRTEKFIVNLKKCYRPTEKNIARLEKTLSSCYQLLSARYQLLPARYQLLPASYQLLPVLPAVTSTRKIIVSVLSDKSFPPKIIYRLRLVTTRTVIR